MQMQWPRFYRHLLFPLPKTRRRTERFVKGLGVPLVVLLIMSFVQPAMLTDKIYIAAQGYSFIIIFLVGWLLLTEMTMKRASCKLTSLRQRPK